MRKNLKKRAPRKTDKNRVPDPPCAKPPLRRGPAAVLKSRGSPISHVHSQPYPNNAAYSRFCPRFAAARF